jgi:two-component system OmpR family sensor kinase
VSGTEGNWRVRVTPIAGGQELAVHALSLREVEATEEGLLLIDAAVTALVLLLIAISAAAVVRIGLRPLTRMEEIATEIAGGDLSRRVADPHTESGRLGTALNTMLVRIEAALADRSASERRLRQFLADASHELRTPLTSIQGFAELYRRGGAPPGPALDEAMARIEGEVGRMRLLVNDLLLLARLDEERPLIRQPVDLLAVAADAVRDAHVRVPTRFVRLAGLDDDAETFEPVTVSGDEPRIRQVVTNLVANALQHTPDDCAVVLRVGRSAGAASGAGGGGGGRRRPGRRRRPGASGRPGGRRHRGRRRWAGHEYRRRAARVRTALPGRPQPRPPPRRRRAGPRHRRVDRGGPRRARRVAHRGGRRRPVPGAVTG